MTKSQKQHKSKSATRPKAPAQRRKRQESDSSDSEAPVPKKAKTTRKSKAGKDGNKTREKQGKRKEAPPTESEKDDEETVEEIEAGTEEIEDGGGPGEPEACDSESQVRGLVHPHENKSLTFPVHKEDLPDVSAPTMSIVKTDSTKDLLTCFTEKVKVKFSKADGTFEVLRGRWCQLCR